MRFARSVGVGREQEELLKRARTEKHRRETRGNCNGEDARRVGRRTWHFYGTGRQADRQAERQEFVVRDTSLGKEVSQ